MYKSLISLFIVLFYLSLYIMNNKSNLSIIFLSNFILFKLVKDKV
jgi:uncharacterized membrane protein YGL010W